MAGDVKVAVAYGSCPTTTTATADFTVSGFGTPKACIVITSKDPTDDTSVHDIHAASIGFSDFTSNFCIAHQDRHNSAKVDSDGLKSNTSCYQEIHIDATIYRKGTASAITDGVRLTNSVGFNANVSIATVIMFGGADLEVSLDSVSTPNSVGGTTVVTTNIDQNLVFFIGTDISGEDSVSSGVNNSFGVASINDAHDTFANHCIGWASDHNATEGDPTAEIFSDQCLGILTEGGSEDWGLEVTAAGTTSYTVTERVAKSGSGMECYALALNLDDRGFKIGAVDGPTSGATWAPSVSLGFTPQYVGLGLTDLTTSDSPAVDAEAGVMGISSNAGSGEETCHSWYNADNSATTDTASLFRSRAIDLRDHDTATVLQDHSHSSFDSGGWTYTINTENETVAKKWFYWAIEAAAAASTTYTKTYSLDALLQKTEAKTASLDAMLQKALTQTVSLDALVVLTAELTASLDALLEKQGLTKTHNMDALLEKQDIILTASLDALVVNTMLKTASLDALLQKTGTRTTNLDALLQIAATSTSSLDAMLQKQGLELTISLDAVLAKTMSRSASLDAMLQKTGTSTSSLDALLQAALTRTTSLDALLRKQDILTSALLDAKLQKQGLLGTASLDALLRKQGVETTTSLDAMLQKQGLMVTSSLDALLVQTFTNTASLDALLQATVTTSASLDALLQRQAIEAQASLDAVLVKTIQLTVGVDALLRNTETKTASLDALLQKVETATASVDALLERQGIEVTTNIDAMLQKTETVSASLDALLRKTATLTFGVDALLQAQGLTVTAGIDAIVNAQGTNLLTAVLDALLQRTGISVSATVDAILEVVAVKKRRDEQRGGGRGPQRARRYREEILLEDEELMEIVSVFMFMEELR